MNEVNNATISSMERVNMTKQVQMQRQTPKKHANRKLLVGTSKKTL